ncbi:hypothetical protein [Nocardioides sp. CFH 31398]|uniref:hypothetical protein n=1 Tax=Nocardioides sp. CFH 31398 TaxID=2919579 RepID=UPI001F05E5D6|nr:hypothetical protein [Nocardioides sp. CFH 31398]MCH1867549.1 hypothetical protein [Nocardioides sp. CFH 31398]
MTPSSDPPSPGPGLHDEVLEAALRLSRARDAFAARYAATEGDDHGRVVARGEQLFDYVMAASFGWRELLATRTASPSGAAGILAGLRNNRRIIDTGTRMESVFADHGFGDDLPELLGGQPSESRLGFVPFEMKILDQHKVMLEGPQVGDERSLMIVEHPAVLAAARAYWQAARRAARPAAEVAERGPAALAQFSARQRAVIALLTRDVADDRAAELLGISVRTLRAEVAAVKDRLGVGSRFAAGVALGRLRAQD